MKFLHTSDWHIGRAIRSQSRLGEQQAALQQVLDHAREQTIDCLLLAGDVWDTSAPSPESEALVYWFFRELYGLGIPAVVVAGNHDHPKRLDAVAPLLSSMKIRALGRPRHEGAVIEVESRDGRETALVAALPWVNERETVEFEALQGEMGTPLTQYAERLGQLMQLLASSFRPDTCNLIAAHLLAYDAVVGQGGGERELHMAMGLYGVRREAIPSESQYTALGHVHKPQTIRSSPRIDYCGSLLQLDFGEREQDKFVNLVEVHPRLPAQVTQLPITAGRPLIDVGSAGRGVALNELAQYRNDDAYLRVFVDVDMPVANLSQMVREQLPSAVHVERSRNYQEAPSARDEQGDRLGPQDLFSKFYASKLGRGHEPATETMDLFRHLLDEESHAASEA